MIKATPSSQCAMLLIENITNVLDKLPKDTYKEDLTFIIEVVKEVVICIPLKTEADKITYREVMYGLTFFKEVLAKIN
jgi:hypothetical protein